MVRSTVDYHTLSVRTKRKDPDVPRAVGDLGDGYSLFAYLLSYLEHVKGRLIKDEGRERLYSVSSYETHGRLVLIEILSGQYGESAKIMDALRGGIVTEIPPDQAAVKPVRVVFALPKADGIRQAIYAVEHAESINGSYVIDSFAKCMRKAFPDSFFPMYSIMEKEAWIDSSSLISMSVPIGQADQQITLDNGIDDDPKETAFGRMSLVIQPPKGAAKFAPGFWKSMRKKVEQAGLLTIPALTEGPLDKALVSVVAEGADHRRKAFTIGNEKTPRVREIITDYGEPRLDKGALRRKLSEGIVEKYREEQFDNFRSGWDQGVNDERIPGDDVIDWSRFIDETREGDDEN